MDEIWRWDMWWLLVKMTDWILPWKHDWICVVSVHQISVWSFFRIAYSPCWSHFVFRIPDEMPGGLPPHVDFSMIAGDFLEVYRSSEKEWDCVATSFFIDTVWSHPRTSWQRPRAKQDHAWLSSKSGWSCKYDQQASNIVQYVERIHSLLADGGIWINLGPLLYHYSVQSPVVYSSTDLTDCFILKFQNGWNFHDQYHDEYLLHHNPWEGLPRCRLDWAVLFGIARCGASLWLWDSRWSWANMLLHTGQQYDIPLSPFNNRLDRLRRATWRYVLTKDSQDRIPTQWCTQFTIVLSLLPSRSRLAVGYALKPFS